MQWELAQLDRHGTVNITVRGLRVQSLLEVTFLAEFILLQCNPGVVTRMIYFRENSIDTLSYVKFTNTFIPVAKLIMNRCIVRCQETG